MKFFYVDSDEGKENLKRLTKEVRDIIENDHFMIDVKQVHEFVEPISTTIRKLESDNATIFDVFPEFINLIRIYESKSTRASSPKKEAFTAIVRVLNKRLSVLDEDPFVLAFFFNPPFRKVACSLKYREDDIKVKLLALLKKWNYKKKFVDVVMQQFKLYFNCIEPYNANNPS